jgi:putative MATE family efflux protein
LNDAARLLGAPPLRALLSLALPTTVVMALGAMSGVLHTYFVSRLGAEAIAAVSLVFPVSLIMTTMTAGGIGAGVSAAVAQALGAHRPAEAASVAEQAVVIALAAAALLTTAVLLGARPLFALLGAEGAVLDGATLFARVLFGGSIVTLAVTTFDCLLRGEGNVRIPSICGTVSLLLQIGFTPLFMFPLGMGLAGAAAATIAGQFISGVPRAIHIYRGRGQVRPRLALPAPSLEPIRQILRVGVPASLSTLANHVGLILLTAVVARYGTGAIAGFGLGTRLDFLVILLAFGLGSATLTLVALAAGAGDVRRVDTIVVRSVAAVVAFLGIVGGCLAWRPAIWIHLFSRDPEILRVGAQYLRAVAPSYPFVGASMVLAFAFQGLGRAFFPFALVFGRTIVVVAGSIALASAGAPASAVFVLMACGNMASAALLFWRLRALLAGRAVVRGKATPDDLESLA